MNNETQKKSVRDNVLEAIKKGKVKMRPKWHFVLRGALLGFSTILVLLTIIYILSFIFFMMHQNGVWFVPSFGFLAFRTFIFSLPWLLIILAIVCIVILEFLVRYYSFGYRRPILYSMLGVIGLVIAGGIVIAATPIHGRFLRTAREGHLPIAGKFYRDFDRQHFHDVHPGVITQLTQDGFNIKTANDDVFSVEITPETRLPLGLNFSVNDRVVVLGEEGSSTIKALGVRKIDDDQFGTTSIRRGPGPRPHFYPRFAPQP
jgi:hypothetical protein